MHAAAFHQQLSYGVRGVSQIKFTMSNSFLVFFVFDILSTIKRKNPFGFYCVILILNHKNNNKPLTTRLFDWLILLRDSEKG